MKGTSLVCHVAHTNHDENRDNFAYFDALDQSSDHLCDED
jgi:hypothetical protein